MADKGNLQSLGLGNEKLEGAEFDEIPETLGQTFADPPQPGPYRFKFPSAAAMQTIWSKVESDKYGTRLSADFSDAAVLKIVQSPNNEHNGEDFRWRVSNVPRERTKERILVSDMDLLLRAKGITIRPKTNKGYAEALIKALADQEVSANIEFSWNCRADKEKYVDNGNGGTEKVEGAMGCGNRYYQSGVAKVLSDPNDPTSPRIYPLRITCSNDECGASIRAFPNLGGFKA